MKYSIFLKLFSLLVFSLQAHQKLWQYRNLQAPSAIGSSVSLSTNGNTAKVSSLGDGFVISWMDPSANYTIYSQAYDSFYNPKGSLRTIDVYCWKYVGMTDSATGLGKEIRELRNGNYVVATHEPQMIHLLLYKNDGSILTTTIACGACNSIGLSFPYCQWVSMDILSNGNIVVSYTTQNNNYNMPATSYSLYAQVMDSELNVIKFISPFPSLFSGYTNIVVGLKSGGFVVTQNYLDSSFFL